MARLEGRRKMLRISDRKPPGPVPRKKRNKQPRKRRKHIRTAPLKDKIDLKVPFNRSISRKVIVQFQNTCEQYGLDLNITIEELMNEFNKEFKV